MGSVLITWNIFKGESGQFKHMKEQVVFAIYMTYFIYLVSI